MDNTRKAKIASEHLDLGIKLFELEAIRDSVRNLQKAITMFESLEDYENLVEAYAILGRAYIADGSEEMAVECFLKALAIANANSYSFQIARLYNNIGSRFLELRETDKALEYLAKAEEAIAEGKGKPDPRQESLNTVLGMNMAQAYVQKRNLEMASKYLSAAKKYVGDDSSNPFFVQLSIVECQFALVNGDDEFIKTHIDGLIDAVSRDKSSNEFVKNVTDLCHILKTIDDEAHYKWVLLAFEIYAKNHNTAYLTMTNAHLWADYYKHTGDIPHYQEMCVKHLNAYNKYLKQVQKNRAASIDIRIEIQGKDYHVFFEKYLANLEADEKITDSLRENTDMAGWVNKLQKNSSKLAEIYVDNENLFDRYIEPLIRDEIELDEELAAELLKGIWKLHILGRTEFRIGVELAIKLEPYFEEKKHIEEHIRTLVIITDAYTSLSDSDAFTDCIRYIEKLNSYKNYVAETEDKETKKLICEALFKNDQAMAEHWDTSLSQALEILDGDLDFFDSYNIQKELGLSEDRAKYYREGFIRYIVAAALLGCDKVEPENKDYIRCYEYMKALYENDLARAGEACRVSEQIYGAYVRIQYLIGEISREECYKLHKEYYSYYMIEGKSAGDEHLPEPEQRRFNIMMYFVPEILELADLDTEYEFCDEMVYDYLDYIKKISTKEYGDAVSKVLCTSLTRVLEYIDDVVTAIEIMTTVIVERDINLMIHSHMVAEISRLILEMIYRQNCELLVGNLGIIDEIDATEFWPDVADFVENAALIHDMGLLSLNQISRKQTRKISDLEYRLISRHPKLGADMVRGADHIAQYIPIIEGHHLGWDRIKDEQNSLITSIIQMADCLNAATDNIGRAYSLAKTSDDVLREFDEAKGTRYNPQLVDMMLSDQRFMEELAVLTTEGRKDICYSIYINYLAQQ